jgi:hypothetical protein
VSCPIIELLRAENYGFKTIADITKELCEFVCYAFVDDTDLVLTAETIETKGQELAEKFQSVIDMWEGSLRATGGALVPDKSCWYVIDFRWEDDEWKYMGKDEIPQEIWVRHETTSALVQLKRLEFFEAFKTLGVFLAPDGNFKEEKQRLTDEALEFGERVRTNKMSREEAWHAMKTTILKTLEYPMEATSFNKEEWELIYSKFVYYILPKAGIN